MKYKIYNFVEENKFNILLAAFIIYFIYAQSKISFYKSLNERCLYNIKYDLPKWFDKRILPFYKKKVYSLQNNKKYLVGINKLFNPILFSKKCIHWHNIEKMVNSIKFNEEFDVVIGVLSGGGFIARYLQLAKNIPDLGYIKSNFYSGNSASVQMKNAFSGFLNKNNYLIRMKDITSTNITNKRVLLFDDSLSTGTTMKHIKKYLETKNPKFVKTYVLITTNEKLVDYYNIKQNIPVCWPWGLEID